VGEVARKQVEERRRTHRAGVPEALRRGQGLLRHREGDEAGRTRILGRARKGC